MVATSERVQFGDRLRELLAKDGGVRTQAWLATRSGIDRSLLSRLISNERPPTSETLFALAAALEIGLADLVAGTDAEGRLDSGKDYVRRSDYQEAIGKVIEYEVRIRDVEALSRSLEERFAKEQALRKTIEASVTKVEGERDLALTKLAASESACEAAKTEVARYRSALQRALTQFSALKVQVDELQKELGATKKSSKAGAMLSGVAAIASVATLAYFLGEEPFSPPPGPRSNTRRRKSS